MSREKVDTSPELGGIGSLALLLTGIPLGLWKGYVVSCLWLWFLVPLGVPAIGVLHAWGISILAGFLVLVSLPKIIQTENDAVITIIFGFLYPLVVLGLGMIIHALI